MKTTKNVKTTKELIEKFNSNKWIYEKLDLIWVWWWKYWLYQWDFIRAIWKWIAKWDIKHIFDTVFQNMNNTKLEQLKNDFTL